MSISESAPTPKKGSRPRKPKISVTKADVPHTEGAIDTDESQVPKADPFSAFFESAKSSENVPVRFSTESIPLLYAGWHWSLGIVDKQDEYLSELVDQLAPELPNVRYDREQFVQMLSASLSLSLPEKKRVISSLQDGGLTQWQVDSLLEVFKDETVEFDKLLKTEGPIIVGLFFKCLFDWGHLVFSVVFTNVRLRAAIRAELADDHEHGLQIQRVFVRDDYFWRNAALLAFKVGADDSLIVDATKRGLAYISGAKIEKRNEYVFGLLDDISKYMPKENRKKGLKTRIAAMKAILNLDEVRECDAIMKARTYLFGISTDEFSLENSQASLDCLDVVAKLLAEVPHKDYEPHGVRTMQLAANRFVAIHGHTGDIAAIFDPVWAARLSEKELYGSSIQTAFEINGQGLASAGLLYETLTRRLQKSPNELDDIIHTSSDLLCEAVRLGDMADWVPEAKNAPFPLKIIAAKTLGAALKKALLEQKKAGFPQFNDANKRDRLAHLYFRWMVFFRLCEHLEEVREVLEEIEPIASQLFKDFRVQIWRMAEELGSTNWQYDLARVLDTGSENRQKRILDSVRDTESQTGLVCVLYALTATRDKVQRKIIKNLLGKILEIPPHRLIGIPVNSSLKERVGAVTNLPDIYAGQPIEAEKWKGQYVLNDFKAVMRGLSAAPLELSTPPTTKTRLSTKNKGD
jgi:hypothetical protein